jgi:hypothetical protein
MTGAWEAEPCAARSTAGAAGVFKAVSFGIELGCLGWFLAPGSAVSLVVLCLHGCVDGGTGRASGSDVSDDLPCFLHSPAHPSRIEIYRPVIDGHRVEALLVGVSGGELLAEGGYLAMGAISVIVQHWNMERPIAPPCAASVSRGGGSVSLIRGKSFSPTIRTLHRQRTRHCCRPPAVCGRSFVLSLGHGVVSVEVGAGVGRVSVLAISGSVHLRLGR